MMITMTAERLILNCCARIHFNSLHQETLVSLCDAGVNWDLLLNQAEAHGLAPLLSRHLQEAKIEPPKDALRSLRLLCLRHRQSNSLIVKGLQYLIALLESDEIPSLVLKGAALSQTLYPEIGLRPMRDIDLLLAKEDVEHAQRYLQKNGFVPSSALIPDDHYHLVPLHLNIDGFNVCIELHHELYPDIPPYSKARPFTDLYQNSSTFACDGITVHTLSLEDMLDHLFHHGFHTPLIQEPFKLISMADIVSLVEEKVDEIDWNKINRQMPELFNALPSFHYVSPFTKRVLEKIPPISGKAPTGIGLHFNGWPRLRIAQLKEKGIWHILQSTFSPSRWWIQMYYTPKNRASLIRCLLVTHPAHIFWWVKLFWDLFLETHLPQDCSGERGLRPKWVIVKHAGRLIVAMFRKFI